MAFTAVPSASIYDSERRGEAARGRFGHAPQSPPLCSRASAGPALALDAGDRSFGPPRVGAIVKGTKADDLAKIHGGRNVRFGMITAAEGMEQHGASIYQGTRRELKVGFTEDRKRRDFVRSVGRAGVTKEELRIGTTLAELERLNGGPFQFSGFGWDHGGARPHAARALTGIGITLTHTKNGESKEA